MSSWTPCSIRRLRVAGVLALLDAVDEPLAVGDRESLKRLQCFAALRHGLRDVGGDGYLPLLFVSLDVDFDCIAYVDAELAPDVAVDKEAVHPTSARREIGAVRFTPYPALHADVGLAAERNADFPGNVDAAVHADG